MKNYLGMFNKVVQFNENHKWFGSIGIVSEVEKRDEVIRYLVAIPVPDKEIIYIYVTEDENALEVIGDSIVELVR